MSEYDSLEDSREDSRDAPRTPRTPRTPRKKGSSSRRRKRAPEEPSPGASEAADAPAPTALELNAAARERRWLTFLQQNTEAVALIEDLPPQDQPARALRSHGYALVLERVSNWRVPEALRSRVASSGHSLRLSLSLSLFHLRSRTFFGSTWMGPRVHTLGAEAAAEGAAPSVAVGEVVYLVSCIEDPSCLLVLELVATEYDDVGDRSIEQYGCGWSFLRPFDPARLSRGLSGSLELLAGTPRLLLNLSPSAAPDDLTASALPDVEVRFRLRLHDALLKVRNLLPENVLLGARRHVPGLCRAPAGPGPPLPCVGLDLVPPARSRRRPPHPTPTPTPTPRPPGRPPPLTLRASDLHVLLPRRAAFERRLLSEAARHVPGLGLRVSRGGAASLFGRGRADVELQHRPARPRVAARELWLGLHNGHRPTLGEPWRRVPLGEGRGEEAAPDLLVPESPGTSVLLEGFARDPRHALVALLVYTLELHSDIETVESARGKAPAAPPPRRRASTALPVAAGAGAFLPYDGRRLCLRNAAGGGAAPMAVGLGGGAALRLVARGMVALPPEERAWRQDRRRRAREGRGGAAARPLRALRAGGDGPAAARGPRRGAVGRRGPPVYPRGVPLGGGHLGGLGLGLGLGLGRGPQRRAAGAAEAPVLR